MLKKEKFFYIDTIYTLLLSLILNNNFNENFYFFSEKFPEKIRDKLQDKFIIPNFHKEKIKIIEYIKSKYFFLKMKKIFYENIKGKDFYIQDHIEHSQYFLNNFSNKFILLEDGTLNYNMLRINKEIEKQKIKVKILKKLKRKYIYMIDKIYIPFGVSDKISSVLLTGILSIPDLIKHKVKIINIKHEWENLLEEKQKIILNIFNVDFLDLKKLEKIKNKVLLITQPLSEDGIISEEEKIEIYKKILENKNSKNIYIKPHPREKTDYEKIFPNVIIIKKDFPLEILMLLKIEFTEIITLFSTSALNFKGISNVNFIGTESNYKLKEKFGEIKKVYYKNLSRNNHK